MKRRRRLSRRQSRLDRFAVGVLTLSAGLLLVGIIINKPFESDPWVDSGTLLPQAQQRAAVQADEPLVAQQSAKSEPDSSPQSSDRSKDSFDPSASDQSRNSVRSEAEPDDSPDSLDIAAKPSSESNTEAEPQAQAADDGAARPQVADIARLETATEPPATHALASVARAQFTTGIEAREPINRVESVFSINGRVYSLDGRPLDRLYYFTEITGMGGETVIHRWEYEGITMEETSFEIGDDRYRVYSSKDLPPNAKGDWRVVVTDAQGNVIKTDSFLYQGS
jgi:hypothetical protein